jgi:hypothetical protein
MKLIERKTKYVLEVPGLISGTVIKVPYMMSVLRKYGYYETEERYKEYVVGNEYEKPRQGFDEDNPLLEKYLVEKEGDLDISSIVNGEIVGIIEKDGRVYRGVKVIAEHHEGDIVEHCLRNLASIEHVDLNNVKGVLVLRD